MNSPAVSVIFREASRRRRKREADNHDDDDDISKKSDLAATLAALSGTVRRRLASLRCAVLKILLGSSSDPLEAFGECLDKDLPLSRPLGHMGRGNPLVILEEDRFGFRTRVRLVVDQVQY